MTGSEEATVVDLAISFLARDEAVAAALHDRIADGLNVFFFPRQQETLAGSDGLESMRTPFLTARVVVVLYREPWGQTPWTRVEQAAITDRFLAEGWQWLLFVQLDQSTLPVWLPTTHVRFALEQYGIEQLAGAVKARVQQQGGKLSRPTAMAKARQVQHEADRRADEARLFRDQQWIEGTLHPRIEALLARISDLAGEISRELGMKIVAVAEGWRLILRDHRVTMNVQWRQTYTNVADDRTNSGLLVTEHNGPLHLPRERMMLLFRPTEISRRLFMPGLSLARGVVWREDRSNTPPVDDEELAQRVVTDFVSLIDRVNRGEVTLNYL